MMIIYKHAKTYERLSFKLDNVYFMSRKKSFQKKRSHSERKQIRARGRHFLLLFVYLTHCHNICKSVRNANSCLFCVPWVVKRIFKPSWFTFFLCVLYESRAMFMKIRHSYHFERFILFYNNCCQTLPASISATSPKTFISIFLIFFFLSFFPFSFSHSFCHASTWFSFRIFILALPKSENKIKKKKRKWRKKWKERKERKNKKWRWFLKVLYWWPRRWRNISNVEPVIQSETVIGTVNLECSPARSPDSPKIFLCYFGCLFILSLCVSFCGKTQSNVLALQSSQSYSHFILFILSFFKLKIPLSTVHSFFLG